MRPGEWQTLLNEWTERNTFRDGRKLTFPQELVAGTEKMIARVVDFKQNKKMWSPLMLGEALTTRAFTKSNDINELARQMHRMEAKFGIVGVGWQIGMLIPSVLRRQMVSKFTRFSL